MKARPSDLLFPAVSPPGRFRRSQRQNTQSAGGCRGFAVRRRVRRQRLRSRKLEAVANGHARERISAILTKEVAL